MKLEKMWRKNINGEREFTAGKEAWELAATAAGQCLVFAPDDEDEQVSDDPVSCYNCRYRRWTPISFICLKTRFSSNP